MINYALRAATDDVDRFRDGSNANGTPRGVP
jgi:hypothetical protein